MRTPWGKVRFQFTAAILMAAAAFAFSPAALAQDGLARFESEIRPKMPPGALTYRSGSALGPTGFILRDAVIQAPADNPGDKPPAPVRIKTITIEDVDLDKLARDEAPSFAKMRLEGIEVTLDGLTNKDLRTGLGVDKLTIDAALDYRYEAARALATLSKLEIDLHGLGRFELSMVLDGVTEASISNPDSAKDTINLRTGSLVFTDASLLSKLMPMIAAETGLSVSAMIEVAIVGMDAMTPAPSPATKAVIDALAGFLTDYAKPKGPLRISVNPPSAATSAQIEKLADVNAMVTAAGLSVSYAGARVGGAASAPSQGKPASATPGPAGECKPGARFFAFQESAWHAVTVRESTSSNRCVVRLDDGSADDVIMPMNRLTAWSLDGPGQPVTACRPGDAVLGETDGIWYPAKVKKGQTPAGRCALTYDGMDSSEDDVLPIKRVRTLR
jgi:hypothetical protein